ncbi:MAG: cobalamin-binding protein [Desulfobulbaceae bacterium]|jgi:iron complex transport system substrate-binding protein|nr:cobalamin-binding protein [Desulfobulbaceae bacterium]
MTMLIRCVLVISLALTLAWTGWAGAGRAAGFRLLEDQTGRTVQVPAQPRRIVSLVPSLTEIVFDLGRGDLLVGATLYADEPPAAAALPRVGSYQHPDIERIVALRPDLCLATRDGNPGHVIRRIEGLAIPVFAFDPRTLPEIVESVLLLGELLDAGERAAEIAREMEGKMAGVERTVLVAADRPTVFFQIDAAPMISAGSGTFIDTLITAAGGRNLAAGPAGYPRFSWEAILAMRPEVVIIASMAGGHTEEELQREWLRWPEIPAVQNGRVHVVDAGLFDRPVPRLADALVSLVRLLHPDGAGNGR